MTQKFLPLLRQYQGRVINVSSLLGKFAISGFGVYCASKFALEGECVRPFLTRRGQAAGREGMLTGRLSGRSGGSCTQGCRTL